LEKSRVSSSKKGPVQIELDGRAIPADSRKSLIEVCAENGARVPALCWSPGLSCAGTCRMCLVECDGETLAACQVFPQEGMRVQTQSPQLVQLRRGVLELILSETGAPLPGTALEKLTIEYSVTLPPPVLAARPAIDRRHPYLSADFSRCMVCQLCVSACNEVADRNVFALTGEGLSARITLMDEAGVAASGCVTCGACAAVCPSGALQEADFSLFRGVAGIRVERLRDACAKKDRVDGEFPWLIAASKSLTPVESRVMGLGVHPDDAASLRIRDGDPLEVIGRRGKFRQKAVLTSRVPRGMLFLAAGVLEDFLAPAGDWRAAAVRIRKLNALEAELPGDTEFELRPPVVPAIAAEPELNRRRFGRKNSE
jgi:predicted molibdopterin-dependent oxidoreductase YjgC